MCTDFKGVLYGKMGGLVNVDFRSFVHLSVNHVAAHDGKFQWIGFAHHAKVDFAVLQAGVGRNRDVVALFVGIGKRNEHSFGFDGLVGHDDFVVLLAVSDIIPDDIFHIGVETTAWVVGIIFGNLCVEACSGDADERYAVDGHGVNLVSLALVDDHNGFHRI